ncbi:ABC transporter permease [Streptomyces sp. R302]|uniref:ABC transporter permease n=1 Tax=unclassified Streptomyces TaxID=2593676 RepID=UPI00145CF992|nr:MULTISPECIES: ABC transporter permease [unclassified Streptomyces]NML51897.1 ABC transporter permease [Streptomyces sp. R301]NML81517.1 ABC transporter permease [Streptomyces sp. R302]
MTTVIAAVVEPRARFRDLVASEWLKLWSLRSTGWSLLLGTLAVAAFNVGTAWDHWRYWDAYDEASRAAFVTNGMALGDAFTGNAATVLVLWCAAMGAVAVAGEYGSGQVRTTFAAVPARGALVSARALVLAGVHAGFGAVVAGGSFWASQAVLSLRGVGVSLDHPGAVRLVVASALLAPVSALAGMALGAVLRRGAPAVVGAVVVLLVLPMVLSEERRLTAVLAHATPFRAWHRLAGEGAPGPYPWTTGGAWLVYGAWAAAAVLVTVVAVRRRDQ